MVGLRVEPPGPIPASTITAPMRAPGLNVRGNDETVLSATPGAGVRRAEPRTRHRPPRRKMIGWNYAEALSGQWLRVPPPCTFLEE